MPAVVRPTRLFVSGTICALVFVALLAWIAGKQGAIGLTIVVYSCCIALLVATLSSKCVVDGHCARLIVGPVTLRSVRTAGSFIVIEVGPLLPYLRYPVLRTIDGDLKLRFVTSIEGSYSKFDELQRIVDSEQGFPESNE